jgi:CTP:molybdopterin cytidylyltransferase MocA
VADRPAPLVLLPEPAPDEAPFGSYEAVLATGRHLLAAELSQRLAAQGAATRAVPADRTRGAYHWGGWFSAAAGAARREASTLDAIGWVGAGALGLVGDETLEALLSPVAGEVATNNRYSADAFVVAGDLDAAIGALAGLGADNGAPRALEAAGFAVRDLASAAWSRFDVDTPQDLALLRLATRLPGTRRLDPALTAFLEGVQLPGGRPLAIPRIEDVLAVLRSRNAELVVAGRIPSASLVHLEAQAACRVRAYVEERGMRAAPANRPRSLLADWVTEHGPTSLVDRLSDLGDAVILDTRVVMAALVGSADGDLWPSRADRFASDFADPALIGADWLRELTTAAAGASVPFVLGAHTLVSDGLRILADAAWLTAEESS